MGVPYVIVKSKARLGTVVHKKTAAILTLQDVKSEDQKELATIVSAAKVNLYVNRLGRICSLVDLAFVATTKLRSSRGFGVEACVETSLRRS